MSLADKINTILKEASDAEINLKSEVSRLILAEKIMFEIDTWVSRIIS